MTLRLHTVSDTSCARGGGGDSAPCIARGGAAGVGRLREPADLAERPPGIDFRPVGTAGTQSGKRNGPTPKMAGGRYGKRAAENRATSQLGYERV